MVLKLRISRCKDDDEMEGQGQPVTPVSQALNSSLLSLSVHVVFEYEDPISDISRHKKALTDAVLSKNPLFSCIMVVIALPGCCLLLQKKDEHGVFRWQKTTVNTDEHTIVADFPAGKESYDARVNEYISELALTPFDQSRPLWEFHFLNYKTSKAEATMVFRFHHALGDGISLMSTLFSIAKRVNNPDLPPRFPRPSVKSISSERSSTTLPNFFHRLCRIIFVVWYTLVDLLSTWLRVIGWIDDSHLPIRGPPGVEKTPVVLSSATFRLQDIKQIMNCVGGTVNDVVTGVVFYGMQRYLQIRLSAVGQHSLQDAYGKRFAIPKESVIKQLKNSRVTAISMINLRALAGLQNLEDMLKPNAQTPWGNRFGFWLVGIPTMGSLENPLDFLRRTKGNLDKFKMSLGIFIIATVLRYLAYLRVPRAVSRPSYNVVTNTTMMISNMIGPVEKIALAGNTVKSFSYFVSGLPQALQVCIVSYMGVVMLQVYAHKAYVDANMLSKCFTEAFKEMKETAIL